MKSITKKLQMCIRDRILTMLYRLTPTLIEEGYVYIAESPLYEINYKEQTWFAYSDKEKNDIVAGELAGKKVSIQRSKGCLLYTSVLGEISISGTMMKVDELANSLQVCLDSGAKRVLLPITSVAELGTVPADLIGSFNLIFYSSAEDAVFKALGVE